MLIAFRTLNRSPQSFLVCKVSNEKSAVGLVGISLYVTWHLSCFWNSLCWTFNSLTIICFREELAGQIYLRSFELSRLTCSYLSKIWMFLAIISLNGIHMPFPPLFSFRYIKNGNICLIHDSISLVAFFVLFRCLWHYWVFYGSSVCFMLCEISLDSGLILTGKMK